MESQRGLSRRGTAVSISKAHSNQNSQKTLTKNSKSISNLKESFIIPSTESHLSKIKDNYSRRLTLNPHHIIPNCEDCEVKTPKELALDVKKCIEELKEEAELYINSSKKNLKILSHHHKKIGDTIDGPDTRETELKDSFNTKTPSSSENFDESKSGAQKLSKDDLTDIKDKIEFLMDKMQRSEDEAKIHQIENVKLKELIVGLEDKLEKIALLHEPVNVSCANKCEVF